MARIFVLLTFLLASSMALSAERTHFQPCSDEEVQTLLGKATGNSVPERVEAFSAEFLSRPYLEHPLGEGTAGEYDRNPNCRLDAFDCTTYVETVAAFAISKTPAAFKENLNRIRYRNGQVGFAKRNHFPSLDWIPNNVEAGFVTDITESVAAGASIAIASALIDKKGWYQALTLERIRSPGSGTTERKKLLRKLRFEGESVVPQEAKLPYIPFAAIFKPKLNEVLLNRIPSGTIVSIVQPNRNLTKSIGTHMNVSHQGLIIRKGNALYLRHASNAGRWRVEEVPLIPHLSGLLGSRFIKGINLLRINEPSLGKQA